MPLDPQDIPIDLQGVDTKSDSKKIAVGKTVQLSNASFASPGQVQKRDGSQDLSTLTTAGTYLTSGVAVAAFQNELNVMDGAKFYSFSENLSKHVSRGPFVPVSLSVTNVLRNTNLQTYPDSAYHAGTGLQCFTWNDSSSSGINYSIIDSVTGTVIVSNAVAGTASGIKAKVLALGSYFIIVYYDLLNGYLWYVPINTVTPTTLGAAVILANDVSQAIGAFDAVISGGSLYVAYRKDTNGVAFYSLSSSLVRSSQYVVSVGVAVRSALTITSDSSGNIWCAFSSFGAPGTLYGMVVNAALTATVLAPVAVYSGLNASGADTFNATIYVSSTIAAVFFEQSAASSANYVTRNTFSITGTVGTATNIILRMGLASKAFAYQGTMYFLGVYGGDIIANAAGAKVPTTLQPTYFLINSSGQIIAKLAPSSAGLYYTNGLLPNVNQLASGAFSVPYLFQDDLSATSAGVFYNTGVMQAQFNFAPANTVSKVQSGQNLHLASGQMWMYDGAQAVEHGFHLYPENLIVTLATTGGGIGPGSSTASVNQIQYVALYEWADNQGQIHRSAASTPFTVNIPSGLTPVGFVANSTSQSPTLTSVSTFANIYVGQVLSDSTNTGNLPAGTYVKAINQAASTITLSQPANGSYTSDNFRSYDVCKIQVTMPTLTSTLKSGVAVVLYRTQNNQSIFYRVTSPQANTSGPNSFIYNSTSQQNVSVYDVAPDSSIVGNEQLYTTGGEVDNFSAPAVSAITTFKNRVIYISPENPFQFGYSKQVIDGTPVEFSALYFIQNIDQKIGRLAAAGPLDDKLILFGARSKYYCAGDGPAPDGSNNDFTEATKIVGVTGCTNQASIIELPTGLMYQDSQRGIYLLDRALQEQYIGAAVEAYNSYQVTSAKLVPNATKAMLTLSNGINLVYDYIANQWETDIYPYSAVDSTIFENTFVYLDASGGLHQQTPGVYNDGGAVIPLSLTTGWMSLAGIEGYQRVMELMILGTYFSPHTLTINIFCDYSATPVQTVTIPVLAQPSNYMFRIQMKQQKCTAMRIQIVESQAGSAGQGLSLTGLALQVGVKRGLNKLQAGASY